MDGCPVVDLSPEQFGSYAATTKAPILPGISEPEYSLKPKKQQRAAMQQVALQYSHQITSHVSRSAATITTNNVALLPVQNMTSRQQQVPQLAVQAVGFLHQQQLHTQVNSMVCTDVDLGTSKKGKGATFKNELGRRLHSIVQEVNTFEAGLSIWCEGTVATQGKPLCQLERNHKDYRSGDDACSKRMSDFKKCIKYIKLWAVVKGHASFLAAAQDMDGIVLQEQVMNKNCSVKMIGAYNSIFGHKNKAEYNYLVPYIPRISDTDDTLGSVASKIQESGLLSAEQLASLLETTEVATQRPHDADGTTAVEPAASQQLSGGSALPTPTPLKLIVTAVSRSRAVKPRALFPTVTVPVAQAAGAETSPAAAHGTRRSTRKTANAPPQHAQDKERNVPDANQETTVGAPVQVQAEAAVAAADQVVTEAGEAATLAQHALQPQDAVVHAQNGDQVIPATWTGPALYEVVSAEQQAPSGAFLGQEERQKIASELVDQIAAEMKRAPACKKRNPETAAALIIAEALPVNTREEILAYRALCSSKASTGKGHTSGYAEFTGYQTRKKARKENDSGNPTDMSTAMAVNFHACPERHRLLWQLFAAVVNLDRKKKP